MKPCVLDRNHTSGGGAKITGFVPGRPRGPAHALSEPRGGRSTRPRQRRRGQPGDGELREQRVALARRAGGGVELLERVERERASRAGSWAARAPPRAHTASVARALAGVAHLRQGDARDVVQERLQQRIRRAARRTARGRARALPRPAGEQRGLGEQRLDERRVDLGTERREARERVLEQLGGLVGATRAGVQAPEQRGGEGDAVLVLPCRARSAARGAAAARPPPGDPDPRAPRRRCSPRRPRRRRRRRACSPRPLSR